MFDQINNLNVQAWKLYNKNVHRAIQLSEEAAQLAQTAGAYGSAYSPGLAVSWYQLGRFHLQLAQYDQALAYLVQAQQLFELLEEPGKVAEVLNFIGTAFAQLGDYAEARQTLIKSLAQAGATQQHSLQASVLNNLGHILNDVGDHAQALTTLADALLIFRELNDVEGQVTTLDGLAVAHLSLNDFDRALDCGLEGITLCRASEAHRNEAAMLDTVGRIYAAQGLNEAADQFYTQALELARKYGYRPEEEISVRHLGALQLQLGHIDSAEAHLQAALAIASELNVRRSQYKCHEVLARLYRRTGDFEKALFHYEQFHTLKETVFNERNEMHLRGLEVQHRLQTAQKEAEIFHLRTVELEREINDRKKAEAALLELAATDALTGLSNRRHVFELAEKAVAVSQRYHRPLAVIMLDIDNFKNINDTYGHGGGDEAIYQFALRIRATLRQSDLLGRYGGDEFLIVSPETDQKSAQRAADRIRASVTGLPIQLKDGSLSLTTSIGLTTNEKDYGLALITLVEQADAALYAAKEAGRDRIQVYEGK